MPDHGRQQRQSERHVEDWPTACFARNGMASSRHTNSPGTTKIGMIAIGRGRSARTRTRPPGTIRAARRRRRWPDRCRRARAAARRPAAASRHVGRPRAKPPPARPGRPPRRATPGRANKAVVHCVTLVRRTLQLRSDWPGGPRTPRTISSTRKPPANTPTCRAKKRVSVRWPKRRARPADGDLQQAVAHPGQQREEAGPRLGGGVAVLVPREQVAGQDGRQRAKPKPHRGPEDQFARRAARAGQDALHDVEDEYRQQHVGRVVVDRPQQPAAGDLVLQEVDAFPGRLALGL